MRIRVRGSGSLMAAAGDLTDQAVRRHGVGLMSDPNHWMVRQVGGARTRAGVPINEHSAMTLPAAFSAIRTIANAMAMVPCQLMRRAINPATGRLETHPATDHRLFNVVARRPNERTTSHRWRQTTFGHAVGWGNGYSEIERNGRGEALGIWQLLPDRTAPELRDGNLRYRTTVENRQFSLPHDDVLHFAGMGWDGFTGYSPIALAREALGLGKATEAFGASFFANDARSGGVLIHPGKLSDPAKDRVRDGFENQGGLENAHRIKVLEEGMKFVPTTIPPEDAQFLATQEFTVAQVARMFGVPLFLLHSHEKSTSWGSGLEEMGNSFVTYTLANWAVSAEQEMDSKLLTEEERASGLYFKFNFNAFLRGNVTARTAFYKAAINDGWMDPDEAREKEDMNARGGDASKLRIPLNVRLEGEPPPEKPAPAKQTAPADNGDTPDE
ncbi:portal protein [Caulobacter phage W2]|uniref:Portal protein n=2 Tax=Kronosvirus TaxID=3425745 RepID=A0AAF0CD31_9CAUD|nr:portal protein [Caulobacter phage TMCBR4]WDS38372.1 portal protein [Caulobacter phage W2]